MFKFLEKNPVLGIEITSAAVRVAAFAGHGKYRTVLSASSSGLQPGIVSESYGAINIHDRSNFLSLLKSVFGAVSAGRPGRAALSLPDGIFRVQTMDLDSLPGKGADRERLIRWRLEKTAAFDLSDTLVRYQTLPRQDAGFTILTCIAKKTVIAQYEAILLELGIEPWSVGLSSFFSLNLYASYCSRKSSAFVLVHLSGDSFTTIISGNGGVRFYRFKDVKRGNDQMTSRLVREIDDSLHFYNHRERSQHPEISHIYLSGDHAACEAVARELTACTPIAVEVLAPDAVLPSDARYGPEMSAVFGAGRTV